MVSYHDVWASQCGNEMRKVIDFTLLINILKTEIFGFKYSLFTIEKEIETCDMMGNYSGQKRMITEQRVLYNNKDYSIIEFMDVVYGRY